MSDTQAPSSPTTEEVVCGECGQPMDDTEIRILDKKCLHRLRRARDEGRREAVRVLEELAADLVNDHRAVPYDVIERIDRVVAGLNASESPPTQVLSAMCQRCGLGRYESIGKPCGDSERHIFDSRDASESPPPATCCGHLPHGNGPCHGMVTDWGGERIPCDCDGRDASESGQPPEASDE